MSFARGVRQTGHAWPPEGVERLTAMAADSKSAGEIARVLKLSRNAVIGKAQRMGLTLHGRGPGSTVQVSWNSKWTPERRERLPLLVAEGMSAPQIAAALGDGITSEAVYTYCSRNRMALNGRQLGRGGRPAGRDAASGALVARPKTSKPLPAPPALEPAAIGAENELADAGFCRHIHGHPGQPGQAWRCCGHSVTERRSRDGGTKPSAYCAFHEARAFERPKPGVKPVFVARRESHLAGMPI